MCRASFATKVVMAEIRNYNLFNQSVSFSSAITPAALFSPSPCKGEGWDGGVIGWCVAHLRALTFYPHPNPPPQMGRGLVRKFLSFVGVVRG